MAIDITKFRAEFPQFADDLKIPDATINIFYSTACMFIDSRDSPCRVLSGDRLELALRYMTAHLLFLIFSQQDDAASGGAPDQGGFTVSATIGEISVTKLAPPATDGWSYWLSSSPYGQALWALLQMLAVGGLSYGGLPEREGFRKGGGVFF